MAPIDQDNPMFQQAVVELGYVEAQNLLQQFNGACTLLEGFELDVQRIVASDATLYVAPLDNISSLTH